MPTWVPRDLAELALFVPLRIAFLVVVALLTRYVAHRLLDRAVRSAVRSHAGSRFRAARALVGASAEVPDRREQRIAALGSLARNATTVVILVVAVIMVLAELGFNVTTIVAGGSVVAVTVAFGLQNVVKDLVSGVFMLVEDQLGVGDYVDLEKASGTVEEIGLRVTQLRADDGTVWYVRNGEVVRVANYSQGGPARPPQPEPTRVALVEPGAPSPVPAVESGSHPEAAAGPAARPGAGQSPGEGQVVGQQGERP